MPLAVDIPRAACDLCRAEVDEADMGACTCHRRLCGECWTYGTHPQHREKERIRQMRERLAFLEWAGDVPPWCADEADGLRRALARIDEEKRREQERYARTNEVMCGGLKASRPTLARRAMERGGTFRTYATRRTA